MKIGYARISTKDQNLDLQTDALKQDGCEKIYAEVMSGTTPWRERSIGNLLENGETGDIIIVAEVSRLGRSSWIKNQSATSLG